MLLDELPGLLALRPRQIFGGLRLAVHSAVLRCFLLGVAPLGLFARGAQINDGTHVEFPMSNASVEISVPNSSTKPILLRCNPVQTMQRL
jgi:hypothetical protein